MNLHCRSGLVPNQAPRPPWSTQPVRLGLTLAPGLKSLEKFHVSLNKQPQGKLV